ncbi:hypothetical protein BRARA_G00881 [Brassica rapa]|uniref:Glutamine amidotransferase domain-containing protein n=1 Tax=Brassica campestris TaxID=3711 RepID=A0A397YNH0_BRACM|nr:hypothetical protein BRARA_G00881 [Brassica rapa]
MFSIKRIVLPVSSLRVLISDNGGYDIVQVVFVPCLLPPKSRSTTRLNPSSPVKLSPNPTSKSRGFLGVSRIKGSIFVLFPLCGRIGVWVRRHVATKASIEMSHFELSAPSAALNSSKKQKGPIIYMGELGCHFEVCRNNELTVKELKSEGKEDNSFLTIYRYPTGLRDLLTNCFGNKTTCSFIWSMYGFAVYRRSFWSPFLVGRYHRLVIEKDSFPSDELEVTAWTEDGLVMATRHRKNKHIQGVQFHPESIITTEGKTIVRITSNLLRKRG